MRYVLIKTCRKSYNRDKRVQSLSRGVCGGGVKGIKLWSMGRGPGECCPWAPNVLAAPLHICQNYCYSLPLKRLKTNKKKSADSVWGVYSPYKLKFVSIFKLNSCDLVDIFGNIILKVNQFIKDRYLLLSFLPSSWCQNYYRWKRERC